ncbi:hypothetical protein [Algoriphagus sp.]|uniref:hypothetical protein n=1 Tax=Algoriphagus sp. TaxID=1872435 RepID=UPI003F72FDF0
MNNKTKTALIDNYEKYAEIGEMYSTKYRQVGLLIPSNIRMLCAILDIRPEKVLQDFLWLLSYGDADLATEKQWKAAQKFFFACQFGQKSYSKKQIKQMFTELKAIKTTFNTIDEMSSENRELFYKNQHMYTQYWYKRWFEKNRRKEELSILEKF